MPFKFKKPEFLEALIGSTAAAALLGALGLKAKKELRAWQQMTQVLEEWHEPADYNPKVVILHHASHMRDALLGQGYGILEIDDRKEVLKAVQQYDSIAAIVMGRGGQIGWKDAKLGAVASLPRITATGSSESVIARLEKGIRKESDRAYRMLSTVAGYYETHSQSQFHEAPDEIKRALSELFEMRRFILRKDTYDSHRGGVISALKSGIPIDRHAGYSGLEGLCIKLESAGDVAEIGNDYLVFQEIGAMVARPHFYAAAGEGKVAVVRDYFLGPTLANALSAIRQDDGAGEKSEAISKKTLGAVFGVAALYHRHKRREEPTTHKRVDDVLAYYRESLSAAYENLAVLSNSPPEKEGLMSLLDEPFLRDRKWYTRILDTSLPNIKLRLGVESPSLEQLLEFYHDNGRVRKESEIMQALGFYDQGYKDRHLVDSFVRTGFSAYISDYGKDVWIDFAKSFFVEEYSAASVIPVSEVLNFRKHMIKLGSALVPQGVVTPGDLAQNFFAVSCYKLLRLIDDAVNGAKRNEVMFAAGEISRGDYCANRAAYIRNAQTHAEGLSVVALTGAEYFSRYNSALTFTNIFTDMKKALRAARNEQDFAFEHPLAVKLLNFHVMGRELMHSGERIAYLLDSMPVPFRVTL